MGNLLILAVIVIILLLRKIYYLNIYLKNIQHIEFNHVKLLEVNDEIKGNSTKDLIELIETQEKLLYYTLRNTVLESHLNAIHKSFKPFDIKNCESFSNN